MIYGNITVHANSRCSHVSRRIEGIYFYPPAIGHDQDVPCLLELVKKKIKTKLRKRFPSA